MKTKGFTLIELMVTVAVVAILASFAVPSFRTMLMNNRLQATRTDIMSAFTFAKSEAIKRGVPVYVTAQAGTFAAGWQVWVDENGNGAVDPGEPAIRQHEAYPSATIITTYDSGGASFTQVGFSGRGFLIGSQKTMTICDGRPGAKGGRITLTPAGTVDLQEDFTC